MWVLAKAGRWLAWGGLAAGLAGLLLGGLGHYSPELDLLANARGHLIGLVAFALLALWLDYRPVLVMALGSFLTLAVHATIAQQAEWPLIGSARAALATPGTWTVLSLNSWHYHPDARALADALSAASADVVVLTEFGPNKISLLHTLEKTYPYHQDCAADWDCAVAILSRHPFTGAGSVREGEGMGPGRAWVTFGVGNEALTVLGAHVTQPLKSPRRHLSELMALAGDARLRPGLVLVTGDFNTTPWTDGFARFVELSGLRQKERFLPSSPSGRSGLPQLAIDHIFASAALRFEDVWLGPDMGSDHLPLVARFAVPAAVQSWLP